MKRGKEILEQLLLIRQRPPSAATGYSGAEVETLACSWLQTKGLYRLSANFRCRFGEIDLIMRDQHTLVFVEVRYRRQPRYGSGAETVDWRKQAKIQKTAAYFLSQHPDLTHYNCRFDVLAATLQHDNTLAWDWISHAFTA